MEKWKKVNEGYGIQHLSFFTLIHTLLHNVCTYADQYRNDSNLVIVCTTDFLFYIIRTYIEYLQN